MNTYIKPTHLIRDNRKNNDEGGFTIWGDTCKIYSHPSSSHTHSVVARCGNKGFAGAFPNTTIPCSAGLADSKSHLFLLSTEHNSGNLIPQHYPIIRLVEYSVFKLKRDDVIFKLNDGEQKDGKDGWKRNKKDYWKKDIC